MKSTALIASALTILLAACTSTPTIQPAQTPVLYEPVASQGECATMAAEVESIDQALGGPAEETPLPTPPSGWQRTGTYIKNLVVQSVLGLFQPVIQTARAVTNAETKERDTEIGHERAMVRRAYLRGAMDTKGCPPVPVPAADVKDTAS